MASIEIKSSSSHMKQTIILHCDLGFLKSVTTKYWEQFDEISLSLSLLKLHETETE